MSLSREEAIGKLLRHYGEPYCCARFSTEHSPLAATAFMHLIGERRLLSIAKTGGITESDDLVYFYSVETLTEEVLEHCREEAMADAFGRIDPNPNHNFSLISLFFVCDEMESEAISKLKHTKFHKEYKKPEAGWVDLRMAAVEVNGRGRAANAMGKALLQIYKIAAV